MRTAQVAKPKPAAQKPAAQPGNRPPPGHPAVPAQPAAPVEKATASHILVQYQGSARAKPTVSRSKDEARARAEEAQKKAQGGANFDARVETWG